MRVFLLYLLVLIIAYKAFPSWGAGGEELYDYHYTSNSECSLDPDSIKIEDEGQYQAIVTYYNSAARCSNPRDLILTAPNGIEVRIKIRLNVGRENGDDREYILLTPIKEDMYISILNEDWVADGDTGSYLITPLAF